MLFIVNLKTVWNIRSGILRHKIRKYFVDLKSEIKKYWELTFVLIVCSLFTIGIGFNQGLIFSLCSFISLLLVWFSYSIYSKMECQIPLLLKLLGIVEDAKTDPYINILRGIAQCIMMGILFITIFKFLLVSY